VQSIWTLANVGARCGEAEMNLATRLSSDDPAFSELTVKQREVLELLAENRTTKEIAAQLGVSDSAVNQRIDPLRQRLGGVTRAELARRYRRVTQDAEAGDGCKVFTGEKLQVEIPAFSGQRVERDDRPGRYRFEDSLGFSHNPWVGRPEPRLVPRLLDGNHAGLARGIAIMLLLLLIVACLVLGLTAAQVLTETLGASRPETTTSQ
jgi:DNA-binding CsgD family transcriptional regulator